MGSVRDVQGHPAMLGMPCLHPMILQGLNQGQPHMGQFQALRPSDGIISCCSDRLVQGTQDLPLISGSPPSGSQINPCRPVGQNRVHRDWGVHAPRLCRSSRSGSMPPRGGRWRWAPALSPAASPAPAAGGASIRAEPAVGGAARSSPLQRSCGLNGAWVSAEDILLQLNRRGCLREEAISKV